MSFVQQEIGIDIRQIPEALFVVVWPSIERESSKVQRKGRRMTFELIANNLLVDQGRIVRGAMELQKLAQIMLYRLSLTR